MNFFIKKNSTLPEVKYPLKQRIMEKYDITDEMLENVAVTFSMIDIDSGIYKIANSNAELRINNDLENKPYEEKYMLVYKFSVKQTSKIGNYAGEFKIDFLDNENCGKITLPVNDKIFIIIEDSITKTTVY